MKSPYNPQSNGKAESAVKIAKNIMRKAKRDKKDLHKAILEWRNTPTNGVNSSPVQRQFNRRTKGIPMAEKLLKPEIPAMNVPEPIQQKQQLAKGYYDRHTNELPELEPGECVRVQQLPATKHGIKWNLWEPLRSGSTDIHT